MNELDSKGITTYCIGLNPHADDDVTDLFGCNNCTVIDRLKPLHSRLPRLFMALPK